MSETSYQLTQQHDAGPAQSADPYGNALHMTADVVLFARGPGDPHVLLIQRSENSDAFPGRWALPGGYVDAAERVTACARRELREETGITALEIPGNWRRVGIYDNPRRDPRGRVVSVAYVEILGDIPAPTAGDDAARAAWFPLQDALHWLRLAFDHGQIIRDAHHILWQ